MGQRTSSLLLSILALLAVSVGAQQHPNFSGEWVAVDSAKVKAMLDLGVSVYRNGLTIRQDADGITLAYEDQYAKPALMVLKFDGSTVYHPGPRGITYMSYAAGWNGSAL